MLKLNIVSHIIYIYYILQIYILYIIVYIIYIHYIGSPMVVVEDEDGDTSGADALAGDVIAGVDEVEEDEASELPKTISQINKNKLSAMNNKINANKNGKQCMDIIYIYIYT